MAQANEKLRKEMAAAPPGHFNIENIDGTHGKVIQMDVALFEMNQLDSKEADSSQGSSQDSSENSSESEDEDDSIPSEVTIDNIKLHNSEGGKGKIEVLDSPASKNKTKTTALQSPQSLAGDCVPPCRHVGEAQKSPALSRVSRMFSVAHPAPNVPQPTRLDLVYTALKRGLTAYLEVHQQEQEKLQGQIRESKRNFHLGFLYVLDKQIKSIECFLRRLEFHASKINKLYEAYCVQLRLWDGAYNMVRAYTTGSPGSQEAQDSLAEATRGHREYTENMCLQERELEAQLGEFHL
ncbi:hypothetical protein P7K49_000832 [Saguinus oedipus]|uniref:FAM65 N-terminal domain-containing protein n=1 Tax=Saguinus oedipus TaxID=9490 RepID=A0ABQ9WCW6_SAGOE|nr:hypothetical protein P7K49_000832 [Saguinus oedipus]